MARKPNLKERVTALEERLKLFEPLPAHKLALPDSTARLRCAKEEARRAQRVMWIVSALSLAVIYATTLFLIVRSAGH